LQNGVNVLRVVPEQNSVKERCELVEVAEDDQIDMDDSDPPSPTPPPTPPTPPPQNLPKSYTSLALLSIYHLLVSHDPNRLFATPVSQTLNPAYHQKISKPMAFENIRGKLLRGEYHISQGQGSPSQGQVSPPSASALLSGLVADVDLLVGNAMSFNLSNTVYFAEAFKIGLHLKRSVPRAVEWLDGRLGECFEEEGGGGKKWEKSYGQLHEHYSTLLTSNFARTLENESSFFALLALRRTSEASLAPLSQRFASASHAHVHPPLAFRTLAQDGEINEEVQRRVRRGTGGEMLREGGTGNEMRLVRGLRSLVERRERGMEGNMSGCSR